MLGFRSVLRAFVLSAMMVSVVHIVQFILKPSYLNESLIDIRGQVSSGYLITALGFGIIFGDLRFGLDLLPTKRTSWLVMVLCLLSIILSFSRTLWLMVVTLVLVALIISNFRAAFRIAIAAGVFIVIGIISNEVYTAETETNPDLTLVGKIMYSMKELQISDYEDIVEINRNWRGFESYLALQTYASGSSADYLFGKGFGTNVELGFTMTLMEEEFDRIPVLHNGYLYLLVKTGAIGLLAYLLYLFQAFRTGTAFSGRLDPESRMSGYLLIALTLIMLETTLVIAGMFNKSGLYSSILLMGILMGYAEDRLTEKVISEVALRGAMQSAPREA
jgi:O-antigen ligase